jgi:nitrous oxidase accessory protein NosD
MILRAALRAMAFLAISTAAEAQVVLVSSPGSYTLASDSLSGDGINIWIAANNVTLNLNGMTVRCMPVDPGTANTVGIHAQAVSNVTIRNGRITGCRFGVLASYASNITLEDVDFTGNTYIAAHLAGGSNHRVRRCTFAGISGFTAESYAIGINGIGSHAIIEDNHFVDLYRQRGGTSVGEGVGVLVEGGATGLVIQRNRFENHRREQMTMGVWLASGSQATVTDNVFANVMAGVASMGHLTATSNTFSLPAPWRGSYAVSSGEGLAARNTIRAYELAIAGAIVDGGGNVVEPIPAPAGRWFRVCLDDAQSCYEGVLPPVSPGGE